jgi:hypothetical protein
MRFEKRQILCCCLVLFLLTTFGCRKKGGQTTSGTGTKAPAPARAPAQAASVDTEKPVSEVQTQAQTMTVDSLKATALKYKEAIVAKQADIEKLTAKIKEIPVAEALGEEAKTLKADLATLETNLKALKDRFQVYYDTLKQKGGDVSNLTL